MFSNNKITSASLKLTKGKLSKREAVRKTGLEDVVPLEELVSVVYFCCSLELCLGS
jgi:hypothetical protein